LHDCAGLLAEERCAVLAAMQTHQHHIQHGVNYLVESHVQLALASHCCQHE
jgi:hypothetical protein